MALAKSYANERAELIAKEHGEGLTPREEGRLRDLTARIGNLVPAMTPKEWAVIYKALDLCGYDPMEPAPTERAP